MSAPTVNVTATITTQNGVGGASAPVVGAIITAKLDRSEPTNLGYIVPEQVSFTTDANGVAVMPLWPNELGTVESIYIIKAKHPTTNATLLDVTASIPNNDCNLATVAYLPPYPGKTDGQLSADSFASIAAAVDSTAADVVATHADVTATETARDTVASPYLFESSVTMGNPAVGGMRFNNANMASATAIAVSASSNAAGNPDISARIATWDDSTSAVKSNMAIVKDVDATVYADYTVSAVVDNGTWLQLTVTYIGGSGVLSAADALHIAQSRVGDAGPTGLAGAAGATDHTLLTKIGTNTHAQIDTHIASTGTAATLNASATGDAAATEVVKGDDTRLADSRTPTTHNHVAADVTDFDTAVSANVRVAANTAKNSYPSADAAKLAGIETGATADQTGAEIKIAYEAELNTNAYTDAEKTNLANQSGMNTGDEVLASTTVAGVSESSTITETDAGTDAVRHVTPASLAGSQLQADVTTNNAKVSDINHVAALLPNVDNTSDVSKPVSTAQQTAMDLKEASLGNPTNDGDVLSSTIAGVRTWSSPASGSSGSSGNRKDFYLSHDFIPQTGLNISDIVELADGTLIGVGTGTTVNNCIYTSIDGKNWTARVSAGATAFSAITMSGTTAIAIGNGVCETSTDGIAWTSRTIPAGNYLSIAATSTLAIAVVANWSGIQLSTDNGATWTAGTLPILSGGAQRALAVNQTTGVFVGSGDGAINHVVSTTTDGATWTPRNSPAYVGFNGSSQIASGPSGEFLIYADQNTTMLHSADDGVTWAVTTPVSDIVNPAVFSYVGYSQAENLWLLGSNSNIYMAENALGLWSGRVLGIGTATLHIASTPMRVIATGGAYTPAPSDLPLSSGPAVITNPTVNQTLAIGDRVIHSGTFTAPINYRVNATSDQIYRTSCYFLAGSSPTDVLVLKPNNTTYAGQFRDDRHAQQTIGTSSNVAVSASNRSGFVVSLAESLQSSMEINTTTATALVQLATIQGGNKFGWAGTAIWKTPITFTTLGTLDVDSGVWTTLTGKIVIERIG